MIKLMQKSFKYYNKNITIINIYFRIKNNELKITISHRQLS